MSAEYLLHKKERGMVLPSREINISHLGKRNIIDSKVPFGSFLVGYVSPQEGKFVGPLLVTVMERLLKSVD